MVVTLLASAGNGVADAGRMPGPDAGNLPQALVGLPGQLLDMPAARHTWESTREPDSWRGFVYMLVCLCVCVCVCVCMSESVSF